MKEEEVEYVVTYILSAQVTEDSYAVFQHHLKCSPDTTLAAIVKWKESFGRNSKSISLSIGPLEILS